MSPAQYEINPFTKNKLIKLYTLYIYIAIQNLINFLHTFISELFIPFACLYISNLSVMPYSIFFCHNSYKNKYINKTIAMYINT